VYYIELKTTA